MRLYEYEAKDLLRKHEIPVPEGSIAFTPSQVKTIAERLGRPVVVKSQVPTGRRGKAGGVRFAQTAEEAERISSDLLGSRLYGYPVNSVLIEETLQITHEYYLGITFDTSAGKPIAIASSEGGVEVEDIAARHPERINSRHVDILLGLQPFECRALAKKSSMNGNTIRQASIILTRLYEVFERYGALTVEVNPLGLDVHGNLMALDAKLEADNAVLSRLGIDVKPEERISDELERKARRLGFAYVRLEGDIGTLCVGAGLAMLTIDLLRLWGGSPANFADTGGGPSISLVSDALRIVLENPSLWGLLVNVYGGLTSLTQTASAIVDTLAQRVPGFPIVAKMHGPEQEEAWKVLESNGIEVSKSIRTEDAARRIVDLVGA